MPLGFGQAAIEAEVLVVLLARVFTHIVCAVDMSSLMRPQWFVVGTKLQVKNPAATRVIQLGWTDSVP